MIKNSRICCCNLICNNFYDNRVFRLTDVNRTPLTVRCIIQYSLAGETITKTSNYIFKDQSANLNFPIGSVNVCFNVINYSLATHPLICNGCIPHLKNTVYEVRGTLENPICVEIT